MQRTPHRCPHCQQPLWIASDMWGPYYLCEDCGWTAEDDADLAQREPLLGPQYFPAAKEDSPVASDPAA